MEFMQSICKPHMQDSERALSGHARHQWCCKSLPYTTVVLVRVLSFNKIRISNKKTDLASVVMSNFASICTLRC